MNLKAPSITPLRPSSSNAISFPSSSCAVLYPFLCASQPIVFFFRGARVDAATMANGSAGGRRSRLRLRLVALLLMTVLLLGASPAEASYGDRLPEFRECVEVGLDCTETPGFEAGDGFGYGGRADCWHGRYASTRTAAPTRTITRTSVSSVLSSSRPLVLSSSRPLVLSLLPGAGASLGEQPQRAAHALTNTRLLSLFPHQPSTAASCSGTAQPNVTTRASTS
jgi:hypothetical protein